MIEKMIPDLFWDNEYWSIRKIGTLDEAKDLLEICDGSIKNVLIICDKCKNVDENISQLFNKVKWIDKLIIKKGNQLVGIYKRTL